MISQYKDLTRRLKDLTSHYNYLTNDDRNMPPYHTDRTKSFKSTDYLTSLNKNLISGHHYLISCKRKLHVITSTCLWWHISAITCHLSDNNDELSDLYVHLSVIYVDLSDQYVHLSEKYNHKQ